MPVNPPRGRCLTDEQKKMVRDVYAATQSMRATARAMGIHDRTVLRILRDVDDAAEKPDPAVVPAFDPVPASSAEPAEPARKTMKYEKTEASDGTAVVRYETTECVKTLEDAVAVAEVDPSVWRVKNWKHRSWTVQMNVRNAKGYNEPVAVQQHSVTLNLERKFPEFVEKALEGVYRRIADRAPKYDSVSFNVHRGKGEPTLAMYGIFDPHFGKLCHAPEAGVNWDLRLAERDYEQVAEDLLRTSLHRNIDRALVIFGNDYYHIDTLRGKYETASGTPQDADGRYHKILEVGEMCFIRYIERLRHEFPVDVKLIQGNHAPTAEFHTARTVHAWFRNCDNVTVDYQPNTRKYYEYGASLLGFTHGNEEKHDMLPGLMASEQSDAWARSKSRVWYLGHYHNFKKFQTKSTETRDGVLIHVLDSIAASDAWHHRRGFCMTRRAAEAFYHGRDSGYLGYDVAYVKDIA